ncbi:beta-ketoacyl-ACP synthase III [Candidatus Poriferisodalis sp.]|uniref:beta-ketoacyl-ACP synthase III n=1 Tax=Candidatus Poriferisodalis sp. TaxID=3101277 RepID=UPI003B52723D
MTLSVGSASSARIVGIGTALGERVLTNDELAQMVDTSDEWIIERTGIKQRNIGGTTAGLAARAGEAAMEVAGVDPSSIDMLILATTTPDRSVPATSSRVQEALGLDCGAMDVNAACSGFVYSLVAGHGMIAMGHERVLVIGAEVLSRITDWTDRATCILFADGSGAAVLERSEQGSDLLGWHVSSDGAMEEHLYCEHGDSIQMAGQAVFKKAVLVMEESARQSMKQAGLTPDDIDVVVPHQANVRIVQTSCKRLGIPFEKAAMVIERTGNTSSASIPLALDDAVRGGRISEGDHVLLVGFGAGMTSASALLRWSGAPAKAS